MDQITKPIGKFSKKFNDKLVNLKRHICIHPYILLNNKVSICDQLKIIGYHPKCAILRDFSKNYTFVIQNKIQSYHWYILRVLFVNIWKMVSYTNFCCSNLDLWFIIQWKCIYFKRNWRVTNLKNAIYFLMYLLQKQKNFAKICKSPILMLMSCGSFFRPLPTLKVNVTK